MKRPADQITNTVVRRVCAASIRAIDSGARTVELAFASEQPVDRLFYTEILALESTSVRAGRLAAGAPLLDNHNPDCQIGVVESWRIDEDRVARAVVRFSKSAKGEEFFQDVIDGIRRSVSVGYLVHRAQEISGASQPVVRVTDWEPLEISLVSIPADISVGVGRSASEGKTMAQERLAPGDTLNVTLSNLVGQMTIDSLPEGESPEELPAEALPTEGEMMMPEEEPQRSKKVTFGDATLILELARQVNHPKVSQLAKLAALQGKSLREFQVIASRAIQQSQSVITTTSTQIVQPPPVIQVARYGRLKNFKGPDAVERAERFGRWFFALLGRSERFRDWGPAKRSAEYCRRNNLVLRATQNEGANEDGGFLVPHEFSSTIIDLREDFGVFRQHAKMEPMSSETKSVPRRTGGLQAYFVNESQQIQSSKKGWGRVGLTAKKIGTIAKYTTELSEDAVINVADDLIAEIAYAFAELEDDCGFNGDATSTYGGITGVCPKLKGLDGTIANIAGLTVATGTGYATNYNSIVLADFHRTKAKLPAYVYRRSSPKWFFSQSFWGAVVEPLLTAAGGNTNTNLQEGFTEKFLGFPVVISQTLPQVSAVSQVCALFGALDMAAMFGERRSFTLAVSEHSSFENDEIEIRGTQRFDIVVHDVGNASGTATARVAGPIVGLITAAS